MGVDDSRTAPADVVVHMKSVEDVLFGLLFRVFFTLQSRLIPPEYQNNREKVDEKHSTQEQQFQLTRPYQRQRMKTYTIHSRHMDTDNDGSNIQEEIRCLKSLLQEKISTMTTKNDRPITEARESRGTAGWDIHDKKATPICTVYIMSDRSKTIGLLSKYVRDYHGCAAVVATHNNTTIQREPPTQPGLSPREDMMLAARIDGGGNKSNLPGHYAEHGPNAGAPFFQDLLVASQARDGFIGHCYRSSSQLVRELVQYERTIEAIQRWEMGKTKVHRRADGPYPEQQQEAPYGTNDVVSIPPLPVCCLESVQRIQRHGKEKS